MAKLQPVPRAPSIVAGREGAVAAALGIALLVAIVKPWGSGTERLEPAPSPTAAPTATPAPGRATSGAFDATLFGPFEPTPEWSIWQAGYFVSVMYVARAPRFEGPPLSGPSVPASSAPAPASSPQPGSEWPSSIVVGPNDHHLWLGINTPLGWTLESAVLRRIAEDGSSSSEVATRRVPSPWESHFTILAMASGDTDPTLMVWPAGRYRLELRVFPGDVRRTLEIRIESRPGRIGGQR